MIIFRVEVQLGDNPSVGVYTSGLVDRCRRNSEYKGSFDGRASDKHPCPRLEKPSFRRRWAMLAWEDRRKWFFGFHSMGDILTWFDCADFRKLLIEGGAKVALYETDGRKIIKGRNQIIFRKDQSKFIQHVSFPT